ncbi:helix-turn-helix domain-containing protein [Salmonella enterica]|uniref:helix-turn-helix domain-containing protein n=1 Tax=Salmonella enterica TaxID=28901 RepID=UPI003161D877
MPKISVMWDNMNATSPKMLAQALRNARKQRKLTQREAAESMCMNQSTVSEFENHPEETRLDTLFKLLAALDLKLQVVNRRGENESSDSWDQEW